MSIGRFIVVSGMVVVLNVFAIFAVQEEIKDSANVCGNKMSQMTCPAHKSKAGCTSRDSATCMYRTSKKTGDTLNKVSTTPKKQIMFFMNPNGRPCQMQLSILDGMKDKLVGLATIKYVKTTEESDQETFYKFGIRGLPSLIILDNNGKEVKRFTPGIQDEKTILSALSASKK